MRKAGAACVFPVYVARSFLPEAWTLPFGRRGFKSGPAHAILKPIWAYSRQTEQLRRIGAASPLTLVPPPAIRVSALEAA